jgi:hypothetical protein
LQLLSKTNFSQTNSFDRQFLYNHRLILGIGDLHAPFVHRLYIRWIIEEVIPALKPTHIVQVGDLYDFFSLSRFPRYPWLIAPQDEYEQGIAVAQEFWRTIKKKASNASLIQIKGNHCDRLQKRITEKLPEIVPLIDMSQFWDFPGVRVVLDSREPVSIGDTLICHGWLGQLGAHARYFGSSVMCGHTHRGGVAELVEYKRNIVEINCGYGADPRHEALKYGPSKFQRWTLGVGFKDELGGRFIRYPG